MHREWLPFGDRRWPDVFGRVRRLVPDTTNVLRAEISAPSGLNSVPTRSTTGRSRFLRDPRIAVLTSRRSQLRELVSVPPLSSPHETFARDGRSGRELSNERGQMLLRKEVIQPHLPVRLPCYDFVPIADPTFDGSLHKGWATGFGCYRLS